MNNITTRPFKREEIKDIECRFVTYVPPATDSFGRVERDDYHIVKELIHLKDGRTVPHLHFIQNYEYKFWVTRPAWQNHKSKKEWEEVSKLQEFRTTKSQMTERVAGALQMKHVLRNSAKKRPHQIMRELATSPYLYGTDAESTVLIKQMYRKHFKSEGTEQTVACFDTETDMIRGHGKINIATLSFKDKIVTSVTEQFLQGIPNAKEKLHVLFKELLGDLVEKRNIKWELNIVQNDLQVIKSCFKRAHEWQPDIVSIWNIDFDMDKMLDTCRAHSVDPKDIFSDPRVPKNNRFFEFKKGSAQKKTEGGKITPIKPAARWHTVFAPASFYFLDAMCVYRHLRNGQGEEPSYGLNAIMKKHIKRGKLNFDAVKDVEGPDWHIEMQTNYPLEYVIYNVFDTVGMELLDEEITDVSVSLPLQAGPSDWKNFNSQPRRVCDEMHFFALEDGYVMGTTGDKMVDEHDSLTIGLSNWISMLPPHPIEDNGLKLIIEFPDVSTNIRLHNGD